ncbi:hypothetical protein KJ636_02955 [Patescibacteria group bacterium]|nr:hypothetical protein [Patescibacteria group bacterium]MBU4481128.1 hypothetical protein [Patescibacteria group bacterium]
MAFNLSIDIAKKLNIDEKDLQRKSIRIFLERELLNLKTELLYLATKYNLKSIKSFEKTIKEGKIHENNETREDFFRWDYLERKIGKLKNLLNAL